MPLGTPTAIEVRMHVGAMFGAAHDPVEASATVNDDTTTAYVAGAGQQHRFTSFLLLPSARFRLSLGPVAVGAGVMFAYFPSDGPQSDHGSTEARGCDPVANPDAAACAPATDIVRDERLFGSFALVIPTLSLGTEF
jgi:hypothetical protein